MVRALIWIYICIFCFNNIAITNDVVETIADFNAPIRISLETFY